MISYSYAHTSKAALNLFHSANEEAEAFKQTVWEFLGVG